MKVPLIEFEQLPFDQLVFIKGRAEYGRQVFFTKDRALVYKLYYPDWEFADMPKQGFEAGYYDTRLVPNFRGLIVDTQGRQRGYIMEHVPQEKHLDYFGWPILSKARLHQLLSGRIPPRLLVARQPRLQRTHLLNLVFEVFERARRTGFIFTEISIPNLWMSAHGYHVFDLDALRSTEWLFAKNPRQSDFVRRLINRQEFSRNLSQVITLHKMVPPAPVTSTDDMARFWRELLTLNGLHGNQAL